MAGTASWQADANGNWGSGRNWVDGTAPGTGDDVVLAPGGTNPFTVTLGGTATIGSLSGQSDATLRLAGGTLRIGDNSSFAGNVEVSNNSSLTADGSLTVDGTFTELANGSVWTDDLQLDGPSATLNGTIAGNELQLATNWTAGPDVDLYDLGAIDNAGTGTLSTAYLGISGTFINESSGKILLNGHTLGLGGSAYLSGTIAGVGPVFVDGSATLDGFTAADKVSIGDFGQITQTGSVDLGIGPDAAASLYIFAEANYTVQGDSSIGKAHQTSLSTIDVEGGGTFTVAEGAVSTIWNADFLDSAPTGGVVDVDGKLVLSGGTASLYGVFLVSSGDLILANHWNMEPGIITSGTLENAGTGELFSGGEIDLNSDTYTFKNDAGAHLAIVPHGQFLLGATSFLSGTIDGDGDFRHPHGTLTLSGLILGGGVQLSNGAVAKQTGAITLGDTLGGGTLTIQGGVYDIKGDYGIATSGAGSSVSSNAGLFEKTAGSGTSVIAAQFTNTGTIDVTQGTLEFTGGFTNTGTIIGVVTMEGTNVLITAAALNAPASLALMGTADANATLSPPDFGSAATSAPMSPVASTPASAVTPYDAQVGSLAAVQLANPAGSFAWSPEHFGASNARRGPVI